MASRRTTDPNTKTGLSKESWSEETEQMIDEAAAESGQPIPTIEELETEAEEIEKVLKEAGHRRDTSGSKDDDTELDELLAGKLPTSKPKNVKGGAPVVSKSKSTKKMSKPNTPASHTPLTKQKIEDLSSPSDPDGYQESFASQQETAEIRGHIESLDNRMMSLETLIENLMKEREGLTSHLHDFRADINRQMTIVSDRLHTALEKDINPSVLTQTKGDIELMTKESSHVLTQLATDTKEEPSANSATSRSAPITTKKRRVQLIK